MNNILKPGIYTVYWKSSGSSLCAIGVLSDGTNWIAPTNWSHKFPQGVSVALTPNFMMKEIQGMELMSIQMDMLKKSKVIIKVVSVRKDHQRGERGGSCKGCIFEDNKEIDCDVIMELLNLVNCIDNHCIFVKEEIT